MKKKYLFFDIDGTLTNPDNREIVQSAVETLDKLRESGHFVGIATGRPYSFAKAIATSVGVDNYVCSGGNTLVLHNQVVEDRPISKLEVLAIIKECQQQQVPFAITTENDVHMISEYEEFQTLLENAKTLHKMNVVPPMDYENIPFYRRVFVALKNGKPINLPIKTLAASNYHKQFLTIEPDDKFLGIERMMNFMHAPIEDVVVFGDGVNDMQMFQKAPFAIAMGNAIEEIKELADYITSNSNEDGIQKACQHFKWI